MKCDSLRRARLLFTKEAKQVPRERAKPILIKGNSDEAHNVVVFFMYFFSLLWPKTVHKTIRFWLCPSN